MNSQEWSAFMHCMGHIKSMGGATKVLLVCIWRGNTGAGEGGACTTNLLPDLQGELGKGQHGNARHGCCNSQVALPFAMVVLLSSAGQAKVGCRQCLVVMVECNQCDQWCAAVRHSVGTV